MLALASATAARGLAGAAVGTGVLQYCPHLQQKAVRHATYYYAGAYADDVLSGVFPRECSCRWCAPSRLAAADQRRGTARPLFMDQWPAHPRHGLVML